LRLCSLLLKRSEASKAELLALNKTLLTALSSATGNILENVTLLASLDETKATAAGIAEDLESARTLQADFDKKRSAYAPVATLGSAAFFALSDLPPLNHFYRFSKAEFIRLVHGALESAPKTADAAMRISAIKTV
jgi:hypothetical protein